MKHSWYTVLILWVRWLALVEIFQLHWYLLVVLDRQRRQSMNLHTKHELSLFYWSHKTWCLQWTWWRVFNIFQLATCVKYLDMQPQTKISLSLNLTWLNTQTLNQSINLLSKFSQLLMREYLQFLTLPLNYNHMTQHDINITQTYLLVYVSARLTMIQ